MVQYIHKSNFETTQFDGDWIILNTNNYTITKLNGSGGFCWSLLNKPQTVNSLSDAVEHEFGSTDKSVKEDVEAFLLDLMNCGLIHHAL